MAKLNLKLMLITLVLLSNNVSILTISEYSVIPPALISIFIIKNFHQLRGGILIFSTIFSIGIFLPLMNVGLDLVKEFIFLLQFIFGFLFFKDVQCIDRIIRLTLIITLMVAMLQWFVPQTESIFSLTMSRVYMPYGSRGASSLFQEPSFYAFFCSAIFFMLWAEVKFYAINKNLWCLILLNLLASGSAMSLIVFPFMFIALKLSFKLKLSILLVLFYFTLVHSNFLDANIRYLSLLKSIFDNGLEIDTSASSRLFFILKDLKQFFECSIYLPTLTAGYQSSFELCGHIAVPDNFIYDPTLSGSLLGRYLVQFGILTLFFISWLFWFLEGKWFNKILALVSFCALFLQMVPITFPIVGIALGYLTSAAYYRGKRDHERRSNAFIPA